MKMNHLRLGSILRHQACSINTQLVRSNATATPVKTGNDRANSARTPSSNFAKTGSNSGRWTKKTFGERGKQDYTRIGLGTQKESQFERARKQLIQKHSEEFTLESQSIFNVLEKVEYYNSCWKQDIESAISFIKDPKFDGKLLSDRQCAVVLKMTGEMNSQLNHEVRNTFTDQLFNLLESKKANLGVQSFNAWLKAKYDNGCSVDIVKFYETLAKKEIEPNVETFENISLNHGRNGDANGIIQLIQTMKEYEMGASTKIISSLVYAFASTNQIEKAKTIMGSFESKKNIINFNELTLSFIKGIAFSGKFDLLQKCIIELGKELDLTQAENTALLFEPLYLFARSSNNTEQVEKIQELIPKTLTAASSQYDIAIGNFYSKILHILNGNNIKLAITLFKSLPESFKFQAQKVVNIVFDRKVKSNADVNEILEDANLMRLGGINQIPLLFAVQEARSGNSSRFYQLFAAFKKSPEYPPFKDRFFVKNIEVGMMLTELHNIKIFDNQVTKFTDIYVLLEQTEQNTTMYGSFEIDMFKKIQENMIQKYLVHDKPFFDRFSALVQKETNLSPEHMKSLFIKNYGISFEESIKSNDLEKAFDTSIKIGDINDKAFGHLDLLVASFKARDIQLFQKVIDQSKKMNSEFSVNIDIAVAFMELGKYELADKTLSQIPYLRISPKKLAFIVTREKRKGNVDVLKHLLRLVYQKRWVESVQLNEMAMSIVNMYVAIVLAIALGVVVAGHDSLYESAYAGIDTNDYQGYFNENDGKWNVNNYYNPYHNFHSHGQQAAHDPFFGLGNFNINDFYAMKYFKFSGYSEESADKLCTEMKYLVDGSTYLTYYCKYINGSIVGPDAPKYPIVSDANVPTPKST
uniref:PPR_long domain-containing protein n=1 Tax=Rhabditophanes sp. KR3021 TaxID=114890 RepID=A0AC35UD29_9BILA